MTESIMDIPRTIEESFHAWWNFDIQEDGLKAQNRLYDKLPFNRVASEDELKAITEPKKILFNSLVDVNHPSFKSPVKINTVEIGNYPKTASDSNNETPIVCSHGYAAGTSFFINNMETFGSIPKSRFYGIDMLGMGLSERVKFPHINTKQSVENRVNEAENFFIDALEAWREAKGINKMILVGHSLGGYVSTVYALRYPQHVKKLILVSPIGFPRNPTITTQESLNNDLSQAEHQDRVHEFSDAPETKTRKFAKNLVNFLWDRNYSPFDILRKTYFFAPLLVSSYSLRRFSSLSPDLQRDLYHYIYAISVQKASSEYSITHLLSFGAYARMPLIDRIQNLDESIPITFLHGNIDWVTGGFEAYQKLKSMGRTNVKYFETNKSGHHLYLDNPKEFNEIISNECKYN